MHGVAGADAPAKQGEKGGRERTHLQELLDDRKLEGTKALEAKRATEHTLQRGLHCLRFCAAFLWAHQQHVRRRTCICAGGSGEADIKVIDGEPIIACIWCWLGVLLSTPNSCWLRGLLIAAGRALC